MVQISSCRTTVSMLLSERHDPNFLPEEPLGIFAFPTSPIPSPILGMFSFVPPKRPNSLYFFLIFPIPDLSGAVCTPHILLLCLSSQHLPAFPPETALLCLERQRKTGMPPTPPLHHTRRWPRWIRQQYKALQHIKHSKTFCCMRLKWQTNKN